ncbi:MAG TPA: hypothetical protein VFV19_11925 [Candidatus Polarisedimenticolaceae bacterium]|nr:hypothetical protein [Candidatus Polarisedimenticolaceae bacterium]
MRRIASSWASFAAAASVVVAGACGKTGPLRPPTPRGPRAPGAVEARQFGSGVEVAFTVPQPMGKDPAQQVARTEILRVDYPKGVTAANDPDAFRFRGTVVAEVGADVAKPGARIVVPDPTVSALADHGIGWTLRYGVRVRDHRDRPSPLVVAQDLPVVGPVEPPTGLKGEATADGVRLSWQAPQPGAADATFNVYRGPSDGLLSERPVNLKPLTTLTYLDPTVTSGKVYKYIVRTVAATAPPYRESVSSQPAVVDASDKFAPKAPTGLVAVQEGKAMRLLWNPGSEPDLDGYYVYRSVGDGGWTKLSDLVHQPSYLDAAVEPGMKVRYRVTAVDRATPPNESEPSAVSEQTVAAEPAGAP